MNSLFRWLVAVILLSAAAVNAQPSGGPYGPLQQRYDVPSSGRVHFVAPDGAAGNSGSAVSEPTTLAAAIERATTGDTIVLRGGIYRVGGLRFNQGITLQPHGDERPILKGTEVLTGWTAQPNGLWRASWKKLFPSKPADWWRRQRHGRETPLYVFNNDMVFLDGEPLRAVGLENAVDATSYAIDYENGEVYLGTDPSKRTVEITAHDSALVRTISDVHGRKSDRKGPVIRGLTFTQYAYRALEIEGTEPTRLADPATFGKEVVGTVLEHLTISHCSRVAGYFRGDGLVIRHCLVSDCGTEGIYVIDSADVLLEKNIVTRTNSAERIAGYYASAVKIFNQSYRVTCRDNLIIDNPYASGIWYDVGNVDGVFVNNWIERTNDGFFFEISRGAVCAGNVFVNCNKGVRVLNSADVLIAQNTFFNSLFSIERTERSAVGDHFGWHPSTGPDVAERHGHVVLNNLFAADETFAEPLIELRQSAVLRDRLKEPQVGALDANVYVRRAGMKPQSLVSWSPADNETGVLELTTLEELRKAYPQFEKQGRSLPDYWGPLFHGTELGNFELLASFPAARGGVALPDRVRAAWGRGETGYPGAYAPLK